MTQRHIVIQRACTARARQSSGDDLKPAAVRGGMVGETHVAQEDVFLHARPGFAEDPSPDALERQGAPTDTA